jgi:two-component system, OmpR family, alkaline phosphatase synthesis response regulator PhoP
MHTILVISGHLLNLPVALEGAGYEVYSATDVDTGLTLLRKMQPPLIVLDAALPLDVLRLIRQESDSYVLMLAAHNDDTERIIALELGADDYAAYPFTMREIVARVRSGFRRLRLTSMPYPPQETTAPLRYEGLTLDTSRRRVTLNGQRVNLTPTEFNLLATLMRHPGVVFSRAQLIHQRHNTDYDSLERTLDSHIRNLRRKIEPDGMQPVYIQTVYGIGYKFGDSEPA